MKPHDALKTHPPATFGATGQQMHRGPCVCGPCEKWADCPYRDPPQLFFIFVFLKPNLDMRLGFALTYLTARVAIFCRGRYQKSSISRDLERIGGRGWPGFVEETILHNPHTEIARRPPARFFFFFRKSPGGSYEILVTCDQLRAFGPRWSQVIQISSAPLRLSQKKKNRLAIKMITLPDAQIRRTRSLCTS